jgi:AraC family transcriptional regulator, arabinose operon regulatory protein
MNPLAAQSTREPKASLRPADPRIARALHLMDANLDRTLSIADLASEAGLSPSRFVHLFHAETGSTPARMFLRMR